MAFGLNDPTIKRIQAVFARFPEIEEVLLYGSRAMGNFKPGSDIDLAIKGSRQDLSLLSALSMELDDLLLPFLIDLSFYQHIQNPDLLAHIQRVGKTFYTRAGTDSSERIAQVE